LYEAGISIDEIDTIFISHKHPDHFMGLIHFLFALRSPSFNKNKDLNIYGFKGLKEYLKKFERILGKWIKPDCKINIIENPEGCFEGINYKFVETVHTKESVGILLEKSKKKIFYTGDTEYSSDLANCCKEIDLLIADCGSNIQNSIKGHMNYEEVLQLGKKLKTKIILMTHFYPGSDNFDVNMSEHNILVIKAYDLTKIYL
jgi:ribonuclease BN (tRNA processing enzyme)